MKKIIRFLKGFLQGREKEKQKAATVISCTILQSLIVACFLCSLLIEVKFDLYQDLGVLTAVYFLIVDIRFTRERTFFSTGKKIIGFFSRYGHVMTVKTWKRIKKKSPLVYKRLTKGEIVDPYELKKFIKGSKIKYYINDEGTVKVYLSKKQCLFSCSDLCHYDAREVQGKLILEN